jgi:hypothetical protein
MNSALVWLVPLTPATMVLAYAAYRRMSGQRRRAAYEAKRRRNIAHERAWTMFRGRKTRELLTYRGDDRRT